MGLACGCSAGPLTARAVSQILRGLNHDHIVLMLDTFETSREICVVTEFAQGELFHIREDDQYLPEEEVQKISKQLVQALYYLHSNRIIHRDMKPQNILIGAGGRVGTAADGTSTQLRTHDLTPRAAATR